MADRSVRLGRLLYSTLDLATFETRFLRILPNDFDANTPWICCELVHASFVNTPDYVALSYYWGDLSVTTPIIVDGFEHPVTVNLDAALRQLRKRGVDLVWVDAICINQTDLFERSYQVQRMGQIYGKATKVVSWVGSASSSVDLPTDWPSFRSFMETLCRSPYWSRIWIIQEVSKAKSVEIWQGTRSLSLGFFLGQVLTKNVRPVAGRIPDEYHLTAPEYGWLRALQNFWERETQSHIAVPRMLLSEVLLMSRHSLATDNRDKLYALLSLTLDGHEVVPTPNYTQSEHEVFENANKVMMVTQGQMALIMLGARCKNNRLSWAPNWLELDPDLPPWILEAVLQERETLRFNFALGEDGRDLQINGRILDIVSWTPSDRGAQTVSCHYTLMDVDEIGRFVVSIWDALTLRRSASSQEDLGRSGEAGHRAGDEDVALALVGLCLHKHNHPVPRKLAEWFEKSSQCVFGGRTLRDLFNTYIRVRQEKPVGTESIFLRPVPKNDPRMRAATYDLRPEANKIHQGLKNMQRYGMNVVFTQTAMAAVVHKDSRPGDFICRLINCPLLVVLRKAAPIPPTPTHRYTYIGEVLLQSDSIDQVNRPLETFHIE